MHSNHNIGYSNILNTLDDTYLKTASIETYIPPLKTEVATDVSATILQEEIIKEEQAEKEVKGEEEVKEEEKAAITASTLPPTTNACVFFCAYDNIVKYLC